MQGKRERNGKLSRKPEHVQARRSADEQAAMAPVKWARMHQHDLSESDAGTDLAGSVVGRLYLAGTIEPEQLSAARLFVDTYAAYQRAIDSPRPSVTANIGGTSRPIPPDVTPERANEARKQWGTIMGILQAANNVHRGAAIYAACDYIVLRDLALPHFEQDLKLGLGAIAQAYRMTDRRAA